jgi:2-(1,2-epoxy-1,2-dihydrophenyl)acetyl-CoA isomerase
MVGAQRARELFLSTREVGAAEAVSMGLAMEQHEPPALLPRALALAADFVLVTPRARFCMVFMRMGLVPDCGATYTLPRKVGAQRAHELFLSAREVGAAEAVSLGIAMEQQEPAALMPRALALADSFAAASPLAVSLVKRFTLDAGAMEAAFEAEANAQALCFQTTPHREAVQRFFDKKALAFQWPNQEK